MMKSPLLILALLSTGVLGVATCSFAQDAKPEKTKQTKKADKAAEDRKAATDADETAYKAAIKGLQRVDGPVPLFVKKKEIFAEISEDMIGKILMCQTTLASGFGGLDYQAGDSVGPNEVQAFRLDRDDDQIWFVRPNLRFRWLKDDPLAVSSTRSLPEAILGGYKIEQRNPAKKLLLVNLTSFFNGDISKVGDLVNAGTGGTYSLDAGKSSVDRAQGFPDDTVVRMNLHYFSAKGSEPNPILVLLGLASEDQLEDSRSVPLKVTYSLWIRKDDGYVPRLSDPRIGYFTESFYNMAKFLQDDRTERYISRWNLVKKDPGARLSEAVKPIVWTLDPSIPKSYRPAIREGILRWNKAFEAIGFKDAIQVREASESDPDYDHSDGRYNVIRWTMTPSSGYAVAIPRIDPFTGEILNASVTIDANMAYYTVMEHAKSSIPASAAAVYPRMNSAFLRDANRNMPVDRYLWNYEEESAKRSAQKSMTLYGFNRLDCDYGEALSDSSALSYTAALASGMKVSKEDYVKRYLANVVCHEVGHCLGLRHNFVASTFLSTDKLADDYYTSEYGSSGSVMDYNPVNVQAVLKGEGNFYMPTLGPYDTWAIQYGYRSFGARTPEQERAQLQAIASLSGEPGHAYMTDESADDWDPYVVRFDNSSDPVDYSAKQMEAAHRALLYALKNLPQKGEPYAKRTEIILRALAAAFREGRFTARFVGGVTANRTFRGDKGERPSLAPVDSTVQRQAMQLIVKNCLAPGVMSLPPSAMLTLIQDLNQDRAASWSAPMRDLLSTQQQMLYVLLMSSDTMDNIAENAYKLGGKAGTYSLGEHFRTLTNAVFQEVDQIQPVTALRRDLQQYAVAGLITQAGAGPGQLNSDARMYANETLKSLSVRFGSALARGKGLDDLTRLHLRNTKETIDRFLGRQSVAK